MQRDDIPALTIHVTVSWRGIDHSRVSTLLYYISYRISWALSLQLNLRHASKTGRSDGEETIEPKVVYVYVIDTYKGELSNHFWKN